MSAVAPWQDRDELETAYWDGDRTLESAARELGCHPSTVDRWMRRLGVRRMPSGGRETPEEEMMADVAAVAMEVGAAPSRAEYRELGGHMPQTVVRRTGAQWREVKNEAARMAGVPRL